MKKVVFTVAMICPLLGGVGVGYAQIITTIAGNGTAGSIGDGGTATAAELNLPNGVAFDVAGNMYIADASNNRIRMVNSSGIITTVAGNGTAGYSGDGGNATAAELNAPRDVAFDAAGNLFIADTYNNVIRKVTTAGTISTVAGYTITSGFSGDGGAATAAELYDPVGVALDAAGNLYIADYGNYRIRKVSTSGIISTFAGGGSCGSNYCGDGAQATAAGLYFPQGVAVDAAGNVYIVDGGNDVIRKVNTSGIIITIAGSYAARGTYSGDGGQATAAGLYNPYRVALDAAGNLYIADRNNQRIRKVNTAGTISTVAGNGTGGFLGDGGNATAAKLNNPSCVALDASGNLYIADGTNNRIRMVTPPLMVTVNSATICAVSGTATLTASGASTYSWSPSTGLSATTGSVVTATNMNPTTIYTVAGTYTFTAFGTTQTSISMATSTLTANAPYVSFTVSDNGCMGSTAILTASGANTYMWNTGATTATTAVMVGSGTCWVTGYDVNGCQSMNNNSTNISGSYPPPMVSITASSASVCPGGTATLTASGATNYSWSTLEYSTSISVTPSVTTTYNVTGTDTHGCTGTRSQTITVNPLPIVTANTTANTYCTGSGVGIILTGGGASTYTWSGGVNDGVAFLPTISNTYTVTGTDGNGCKNKTTILIPVSNPPSVYINANTSTPCKGDTVTLTGGGALTYTWSAGVSDGVPFIANTSNTYYVTGADLHGCTNTASVTITVSALPTVIIAASTTTVCPGNPVTLTAGGTAFAYAWSDGSIVSGTPFVPTATTTYSLTGTATNGCTKTVTKTITVNPLPTVIAVANPTVVCAGTPVTLSASGATTYTWSTNATTATITVTPSVTTTYTVTGKGANTCTNTATVLASIPANLAPEICLVTTDSATNYQYNIVCWQNTLYPNADSFIVYRYSSGSYLVLGTVSKDSSRFIDANRTIGGPNGGDPGVSGWQYTLAVKDACANISPKSPYHFTSNFQQNNQNLSWSPYQIQSPQSNPLNGYEVLRDSMGVNDFRLFANTSYLTTSTQDPNYALYPNAQYRVDALGFNCTSTLRLANGGNNSPYTIRVRSHSNTQRQHSTGINKLASSNEVNIYPNPNNGSFVIEPNSTTKQTMQVYDVNGKLVLSQAINGKTTIDASTLNEGIYNISLISNEGVVNKRLVIVR